MDSTGLRISNTVRLLKYLWGLGVMPVLLKVLSFQRLVFCVKNICSKKKISILVFLEKSKVLSNDFFFNLNKNTCNYLCILHVLSSSITLRFYLILDKLFSFLNFSSLSTKWKQFICLFPGILNHADLYVSSIQKNFQIFESKVQIMPHRM